MTSEITPTGRLRLGINGTNPTLYIPTADGSAGGIAAEIGRFIAGKLGVAFEPRVYSEPGAFPASFGKGEWDIIVTGRNPHAAQFVDFVADVVLIDYVFLAGAVCNIDDPAEVDRPGIKIGVPRGASAHAFLSRRLKHAEVVPLQASPEAVAAMFANDTIQLYATGTDGVTVIADRAPGSRIIGPFETVAFAVSTQQGLSTEAKSTLARIVNEAKSTGIVQRAIETSGRTSVRAASLS